MFLSDVDIKKALQANDITISDFDESRLQPASYDILLGNKFVVTDSHSSGYSDPSKKIYPRTREVIIADGEPFILHPGVSVLGYVNDYVGARRNYLIHLSGKSSLARAGLIVHNTAGIINPGHYLNMTLELYNTSNVPIILRPKMEIAQFLFSMMSSAPSHDWKQPHEHEYIDVKKYANSQDSIKSNNSSPLAKMSNSMHETQNHPEYQYLNLLRETLEGDEQIDKDHGIKTYSVFGRQIRFDLSHGFPLLTTKKVYWNGVLHELYWFLSGQSNIKYLVDNNVHIWDDYPYKLYNMKIEAGTHPSLTKEEFIERIKTDSEFAKEHGELKHIYGELWRRWPSSDGRPIDQLGWVVDELRKDPDAHNAIVTSWNPEYLYSMASPSKAVRFPICHNMYQINIKNGKVCLQLYQRSADIFLGVPFNIASYALLTLILAKILGREPGEFIHTFGDLHIYENHIEAAKKQLQRTPKPFPVVSISGKIPEIDDFKLDQVILENYEPHDTIKANLVVSGGYNEKLHSTTTNEPIATIVDENVNDEQPVL